MANIPGIDGFIQPGVHARDRVTSSGVSIPGGTRIVCVMGEGLREETIVSQAVGSGADGVKACSPTGSGDGRYFRLQNYPVVAGRTELYLNNSLLYGMEEAIDEDDFDGAFDYRIDIETGCIELQKASIGDQDGKKYSASSINDGNGVVVDGTCGDLDLISVVDASAPAERWTVRAVGVIRDSNGDPIPGRTTFTATGAVSGQLRNSGGSPYLFTDAYVTGTSGAVSGNLDPCTDGFIVASDGAFENGSAVLKDGDATADTTDQFSFLGDLITQGQVLPGDFLCIDGYIGIEIEDLEYDTSTDTTTLTLVTDSLDIGISDVNWEIRATNLFIDNEGVAHNAETGVPASAGNFTSSSIGKILMLCSGDVMGKYRITAVTSSRRVRVVSFDDADVGFPELQDDNSDGLAITGLTYHVLETNEVLLFGIQPGTVPFNVGDKFFIDVNSRVLSKNDSLEAKYISVADLNDPEFFTSAQDLYKKHGIPSLRAQLSLGAQMAFENGAPAILAVQCKPPLPRRTSVTLLEEETSTGTGGFRACGGSADDCEVDDLKFIIPRPNTGLLPGRPDGDTQVNIFVVRDSEETQIFPNKVIFYNSQLESEVGQNDFITSTDTAFSYTIINTDTKVDGTGDDGEVSATDGTFSTLQYDFDAADVGKIIVVQSLEDASGNVYTTVDAISTFLFGNTTTGAELIIQSITDDSTAVVTGNDDDETVLDSDGVEIQFFIKDETDTTNVKAALLLHKDLVDSGALQEGDGIRISYIDEIDIDFYDSNWFEALEILERENCQIIVPLPEQNRSGILRAVINHCNTMSSITIQKERLVFFGAQAGVTAAALIGTEEVAVEDIGILEGIQGDDASEVLDANIEDLVNYKLSDNYDEKRLLYFYPDQIIRNVSGTNTNINGYFIATAAAGWFSGTQNLAIPLTNKVLTGFSIDRSKKHRPITLNLLGSVGVSVLQPVIGGGLVLSGRTTSQSGFIEDEEPSIIFIRDRVKQILRDSVKAFIGGVANENTMGVISSRVNSIMSSLVSKGLISSYGNIKVERDKIVLTQFNIYARYSPNYPLNFIFIDLEVNAG